MKEQNLIMIYEGYFNQEITNSLLTMTEMNMEIGSEDGNIKRKIYDVMCECLQNICKHSAKVEQKDLQDAIFLIGSDSEYYYIASGNTIINDKIDTVTNCLNYVNSLGKDGLKKLFMEMRMIGNVSEVGGAGLGFIDMRRKSKENIDFEFFAIDEEYSFFSIQTRISKMQ
ncbi:MAG: hypothetical protein COC01_04400 [Bacteroidetes bacterium]|nr:MAG: hypothetical protein COC01_04400 [Bacteroidota bacterium]